MNASCLLHALHSDSDLTGEVEGRDVADDISENYD